MTNLIAKSTKQFATAIMLSCGALLSFNAFSLGLGDIQLQSKLGEPLVAQLPLRDTSDLGNDEIIIQQAPLNIYKKLGVESSSHHRRLNFTLNPNHSITITTKEIIKEPFLNFVIELRWPEGQLYREYKLLFDPI